ncbi:MAG TPA: hypothetical protein VF160_09945 [Candidatus Dormibacteraeota bacterium]
MTSRLLALTPVIVLACACGSSANPASTPPPPATSAPAAAGNACTQGVKPGTPGVVTFQCSGTAKVKVSGSVSGEVDGGTCTTAAGLFVVNAGVVVDHTYPGTKPNFLSVNTPPEGGGGQDTAATVVMNGKLWGDSGRFGGTATFSADHKSLQFQGSASNGDQVTIDVTC